jgi:threonine synthase
MLLSCSVCGALADPHPSEWRCSCGGAWEPIERTDFDPALIARDDFSVWRYRKLFGLGAEQPLLRMGVGWTPLLDLTLSGRPITFKLEFMMPSGSFKDRGTTVMVNHLAARGVTSVADDSSGNAGASLAAHAARAGMQARIFVPAYASPAKKAQIAVYGAEVVSVDGPRRNAEHAAQDAAVEGRVYASHAYQPSYLIGQMTAAWEVWEQLGRRAPDWVVTPVAQGGNLLGYWLGFRRLRAAGLIDKEPRLVAVQSALVDPLAEALERNLDTVPAIEPKGYTVAEGIAVSQPARGGRLLHSLRESNGMAIRVDEAAILDAQRALARQGLYVEPTSATTVAALPRVLEHARPDDVIVVPLTGSGLKGTPKL